MKLSVKDPEKLEILISLSGKTVNGFAKEINSSPVYISKIIKGEVHPQPPLAKKIVDGLSTKKNELSIDDIFFTLSANK